MRQERNDKGLHAELPGRFSEGREDHLCKELLFLFLHRELLKEDAVANDSWEDAGVEHAWSSRNMQMGDLIDKRRNRKGARLRKQESVVQVNEGLTTVGSNVDETVSLVPSTVTNIPVLKHYGSSSVGPLE